MADSSSAPSEARNESNKEDIKESKKRAHSPERSDEPSSTTSANGSPPKKIGTSDEGKGSSNEAEQKKQDNMLSVKSANAWEKSEMDGSRKEKFLRLMGAAKKEHTGRFVIGDKNAPTSTATAEMAPPQTKGSVSPDKEKDLEKELETEYKQRMGDHLKHRDMRHRGLGYHGESTSSLDGSAPTFAPAQSQEEVTPSHDVKVDGHVHFVSEDGKKHVDL